MGKTNRLNIYILAAMALAFAVGYVVHDFASPAFITPFAANIKLLGTIFIRLVQMIIAPLVFCTLVVGIAKLGDIKTVGRVGGKALLWFVSASLASLLLGMVLVNRPHRRTGSPDPQQGGKWSRRREYPRIVFPAGTRVPE